MIFLLLVIIPRLQAETPRWRVDLGPDSVSRQWQLVAGRATFEDASVVLQGGSTLVWKDFALSDCEIQFRVRRDASSGVVPALYVRGELDPATQHWSGSRVLWQAPVAARSARWVAGRRSRYPTGSTTWQSVLVRCQGDYVHVQCGRQQWTYPCRARSQGLFALGAVGACGSVTFEDVVVTELSHHAVFNGRDLAGWNGADAVAESCWEVRDGQLLCTGETGPWLRSQETYGDFNLRLEYKLSDGGNSGVYVRVPAGGEHHGEGAGIEVQILDDDAQRYRDLKPYQFAGSLYAIVAPHPGTARASGQWNALEINCRGTHYQVRHNGTLVIDADDSQYPELAQRRREGYLGLQNHSEPVWFRNIRLGPAR